MPIMLSSCLWLLAQRVAVTNPNKLLNLTTMSRRCVQRQPRGTSLPGHVHGCTPVHIDQGLCSFAAALSAAGWCCMMCIYVCAHAQQQHTAVPVKCLVLGKPGLLCIAPWLSACCGILHVLCVSCTAVGFRSGWWAHGVFLKPVTVAVGASQSPFSLSCPCRPVQQPAAVLHPAISSRHACVQLSC